MNAPPTSEQRRAADPARSVWVTANAGTGKTRVLSDRVLRLLLEGADPESILCITFTRAAAAEMIARIERALAGWATEPEEAELAARLEALLGEPPGPERLRRARRLFARVLDLPRGLPVMTIHAFCTQLLRRFPVEAGVAPHFETIDDQSRAELVAEARERMLARIRAAKGRGDLATARDRLAVWLPDSEFQATIEGLMAARIPLLRASEEHGGPEALLAAVRRLLEVEDDPDEPPEVVAEATERSGFDAAGLRFAAGRLAAGDDRDRRRGARILDWLDGDHRDPVAAFHDYEGVFVTKQGTGVKTLATRKVPERDRVERILRREQARVLRVRDRIRALLTWRRSEALLRLGFAVIEEYERLKRQRAALDYDDQIDRARRLLEGGIDWVRYKLDVAIAHVLVDEAQDTNPDQWAVVEKLTEEFFAGEGVHDVPRTLFVVGDEKQSIYRFQGADIDRYRQVRRRLSARAEAARRPIRSVGLDLSFRSTQAVLEVVDRVFADALARRGVVVEGKELRHRSHRRGVAGLVELWPLLRLERRGGESERWPLPDVPRVSPEPERLLAEAIADTVAGWIATGEMLEGRGRPVRPGDVMILLSRRGTIQDLLVRALKRKGVPVAGIDRMDLAEHLAVQDLVALGRVMLLPEDDYSLACLLKSPLVGIDEDTLFRLAHGRGATSLMERLRAAAGDAGEGSAVAAAYRRISEWLRRADFMPPFEFYTWILGADGGRRRLLERLGPDAAEPIEAFLGQTLAYEEGHPASLEGFLHWFAAGARTLKRDPENTGDAVRILTVHGAKGLEAPIVILADAGPHRHRNRERLIWVEDAAGRRLPLWRMPQGERPPVLEEACAREKTAEEEESRRLLYVALTRAEDRLYVAGWLPRNFREPPEDCWHSLLYRALEAMPGVERLPCRLGAAFAGPVLRYRRGEGRREAAVGEPDGEVAPPPDWLHRPAAAEPSRRPRAPSSLHEGEPVVRPPRTPRDALAFRRGRAVHRLLELLPGVPPRERAAAAERLLDVLLPELDEAARRRLREEVERVMAMPELAPLFAPGARAEQAIAGTLDGVPVVGVVDRFAVTAEGVHLVDFKSHPEPPPAGRPPAVYVQQMRAYARVLQGLYPDRRLHAALVWTALPRVDFLRLEEA